MGWLAAIIAIVAITLFAIVYPGFRKFLLILFAAVVALGVGLYLYFENESRQSQTERTNRAIFDSKFRS
jgi:uncharacterized membrane protein